MNLNGANNWDVLQTGMRRFKVDLGKKENYKAYCNERKVWEETLSQAREIWFISS